MSLRGLVLVEKRWRSALLAGAVLTGAMLAGGCQDDRGPVSVHNSDPDLQIVAMKDDVSRHNRADIPQMVEDLSSDDPAIRFYAIEALWRLTYDDFGYQYYQDDDHRAPAVHRWQNWLKQRYPHLEGSSS